MKKGLIIWNIVVTVIALVMVFTACTADTRVDWAVDQIRTQAVTIQQLQSEVNGLKSNESQLLIYVQGHEGRIASIEGTLAQVVAILNAQ